MSKRKVSLPLVGFLQALGLALYCSTVGLIFWKGGAWFGRMSNFWGPVFFLVLFVASALISALVMLCYPFILFWEKKKTKEALMLIGYSTGWLILFLALAILAFILT